MSKDDINSIKNKNTSITSFQFEELLQMQKSFMIKTTTGNNHQRILDDLCISVEAMLPDSKALILLFEKSGLQLKVRSAPSSASSSVEFLDNLTREEKNELYGSSLHVREPHFYCNTALSIPRPNSNFKSFSAELEIATCWSTPIIGENNQLLGVFVLNSIEAKIPYAFHNRVLGICTNIVISVLLHEEKELQLWHLAHHDQLTGLPNRLLFNLSLDHAIKKSNRSNNYIGVFLIDLDHFKEVNDSLGHEYGDIALQEASKRIQDCIRDEDILSRLGGDEFALITENIIKPSSVHQIANKIHNSLAKPFSLNGHTYKLTASIGISFYPRDGEDNRSLLKSADTAMYEAKNQGRSRSIYYRPGLASLLGEHLGLESGLRESNDNDQFSLRL